MTNRWVWIAAILGLLPAGLAAQEAQRVVGSVVDASDRSVIGEAVVRLLNADGQLVASGLSNARGEFSLTVLHAGEHVVEAVHLGYQPTASRVSLEPGATVRVELELQSDAIAMDSIVVIGDRSDRPPRCTPQVLRGRVVPGGSADAEEIISGAAIELLGKDGRMLAAARTNAEGRFTFGTPGPGMYRLRGSAEGYVTADGGEFPILPGDTVEVRFGLSRDDALNAPMEVIASARPWMERFELAGGRAFYDRMADCQTDSPDGSRFAVFIDREVIEEYDGWRTNEMIDWEARVVFGTTPGGHIILFGRCAPPVFVNGALYYGVLKEIPPEELEAVEIHQHPRVPTRFWLPEGQPCGVVALWTRRVPPDADAADHGPVRLLLGGGALVGILYLLFQ
ncbi:MAG: carboxypeptidase-like regulatory domain-containing protein [Gemmatimonadota bacterium]